MRKTFTIIPHYYCSVSRYIIVTCIAIFSSLTIAFAQNEISIRINNGNTITNNHEVSVAIKSVKMPSNMVRQMKIGTKPDLSDLEWRSYSTSTQAITLPDGDGEKFIYVQLKDQAGNESPVNSASITVDSQPPLNCSVTINGGRLYTNDKQGRVLLQLDADDAIQMQVSNNKNFNLVWEGYSNSKRWILDLGGGDGVKKVYARFKDNAGNISEIVEGGIRLDTKPPTNGFIQINDGETFIKSTRVHLKIKADDAARVRVVSKGRGLNFDYEPEEDGFMYIDWDLDSAQGLKVVKAYFQDNARNSTKESVDARTTFDTIPPSPPKFMFAPRAKYTNDADGHVKIQVQANPSDLSPSLKMVVSNYDDFSVADTLKYNSTLSWTLDTKEDGLKSVYIKLCDEALNYSEASKTSIILDRKPPVVYSFVINDSSEWANSNKVFLHSHVSDAQSMQINNNGIFNINLPWTEYDSLLYDWDLTPGDGEKTVYIRFKDAADNISEAFNAKIKIDTKIPEGTITINNGEKVTNHPQGLVNLKFTYDDDVVGMKVDNNPYLDSIKTMPVENQINSWQLSAEDGVKGVFVRFIDKAGNPSKIIYEKILLDRQAPTDCKITINGGSEWTTQSNGQVVLTLEAKNADFMMISNHPEMEESQWETYRPTIPWNLTKEEGLHTIYAKFKDDAGNETGIYSDSIKANFSMPVLKSFTINNGAEYTNDPLKKIIITLEADGAKEMLISNMPTRELPKDQIKWVPFQQKTEWILENEDGPKGIFVRLRNEAGNISSEYRNKIILDRIPPSEGKIIINKNEPWLTNKEGNVTIQLSAKDASYYQLSNNNNFSEDNWTSLTSSEVNWTVPVNENTATVYARFKDEAGNISTEVNASIKIDITPPSNGKISINNGEKYLPDDGRADIQISAEGAAFMRISSQQNFPGIQWEPFQKEKSIILSGKDGERSIYAQFKDEAGNISEIVSTSILLDKTPPSIQKIAIDNGAEWTNAKNKKVDLVIEATDATDMMISQNENFENANWTPYKNNIKVTLEGDDGVKYVFVKLKDEAGNISDPKNASIKLKRQF